MKRYRIKVKLKDGNEVYSIVEARNINDAISRLNRNENFISFTRKTEVLSMDVQPIETKSIDNERFALTDIVNKSGWYVAVDLYNRIKIEFKKNDYNRTNKVEVFGNNNNSPADIATAIRELTDWLNTNFKEIV